MGVVIDDKEMGMAVLNGLPSRYDSLTVALDALGNEDRIFSLDFVKSRLLQEEQRSIMRDSEDTSKANAALMTSAAVVREKVVCTNCGRRGHTAPRCWGKDINGRRPDPPSGYRFNRGSSDLQRRYSLNGSRREKMGKESAFIGQASDHYNAVDETE